MKNLLFIAMLAVSFAACKKKPIEQPTDSLTTNVVAAPPSQQAVAEMRANFQRVQFAYDSATLDSQSRQALDANAGLMQRFTDIRIEVQGHADERGTTDYNIALGQRRGAAVQRYLIEKGVAPTRLTVVSFGEERPLASGHTEVAWSQNRRAEFRITYTSTGEPVSGTTN